MVTQNTAQKPVEGDEAVGATLPAEASNLPALAIPGVVAAQAEATRMVEMIERLATNPGVNPDSLKTFLEMHREAQERAARIAYNSAMAAMQPLLPVIDRKGRIVIKEKGTEKVLQSTGYAKYEDIVEAVNPIMAAHGFAPTFKIDNAPDGKIIVQLQMRHDAGHVETSEVALPHDSTGSKNAVQAIGSTTSYGKRYLFTAALNIVTRGEDDDGKSAISEDTITADQVRVIREKLQQLDIPEGPFLAYMKVEMIEAISAKDYGKALNAIGGSKAAKAKDA